MDDKTPQEILKAPIYATGTNGGVTLAYGFIAGITKMIGLIEILVAM